MRTKAYIDGLASLGQHHFTSNEAYTAIAAGPVAVRAQLRRLKEQRLIAEPVRGFLVILPPEYKQLGCLPAEQFIPQLMSSISEPYYFALLSAAQHHGAAHQRPQASQVVVRKNRKPIEFDKVRVNFIARADMDAMPVTEANTPRGRVRFSTPEVTALELVGYPADGAGLSNVATVVAELAETMDPDKLLAAVNLCPISWAQRLGYLLELVNHDALAAVLKPFVAAQAHTYKPLRRAGSTIGSHRSMTWKLIINVEVVPDL